MKRITLLLSAAVAVIGLASCKSEKLPGTEDAINKAVEQSVSQATDQLIQSLPTNVSNIAVVPLHGDADGFATGTLQHELIQKAAGRFQLVNRDDEGWGRLLNEFQFSEDNFDIMANEEIRQFGRMLGADAIVWGQVHERGADDSGYKGVARLTVYLGEVETGQMAASGRGDARVLIDAGTVGLTLTRQPWFWGLVIFGGVAAVVFIGIYIPLRRRLALATKPREVVR